MRVWGLKRSKNGRGAKKCSKSTTYRKKSGVSQILARFSPSPQRTHSLNEPRGVWETGFDGRLRYMRWWGYPRPPPPREGGTPPPSGEPISGSLGLHFFPKCRGGGGFSAKNMENFIQKVPQITIFGPFLASKLWLVWHQNFLPALHAGIYL